MDDPTTIAIGDSIVWGQGLQHDDKFVTQVHEALTDGEPIPAANLKAHSGAIIGLGESFSSVEWEYGPVGTRIGRHEKPSDGPTILQQLDRLPYDYLAHDGLGEDRQREADRAYDSEADVDLVLLDGGINDIGAVGIANPFKSRSDLVRAVEQHCYRDLSVLLARTRRKFPNATIVVTSYFPFVSHESDLNLKALVALGSLVIGAIFGPIAGIVAAIFGSSKRRRLIEGVLLFNRHQLAAVRRTVAEQRRVDDGPGIVFATPGLRPKNSANAPEAWLWPAREGAIPTGGLGDPEIDELRIDVCDATGSGTGCKKAPTCHPNPDGADAYTRAILDRLDRHRERSVREPVSQLRGGRSDEEVGVREQVERYGFDPTHGLRSELDHEIVDSLTIEIDSQVRGIGSVLLLDLAGEPVPLDVHVPLHPGQVAGPRSVETYHVDPIVSLDRPPESPLRLWELDDVALRREPLGPTPFATSAMDGSDENVAVAGADALDVSTDEEGRVTIDVFADEDAPDPVAVVEEALREDDAFAGEDVETAEPHRIGGGHRRFPSVWDVHRVSLRVNGLHVYEERDHRLVGSEELALEYPHATADARPERARAAP